MLVHEGPFLYYNNKQQALQGEHERFTKKRKLLAWLRFLSIAGIIAVFYFFSNNWYIILPVTFLLLVFFRWVILKDLSNKEDIAHNRHLYAICVDELKALNHQYDQFDNGQSHQPHDHYYANDLDIFGPGSLYQFTNRTVSQMGAGELAGWLLNAAPTNMILQRQEAVKELSQKMDDCHHLQAYGKTASISTNSFKKLVRWMENDPVFTGTVFKWIRWILPLVSVGITVATIFDWVSLNVFYLTMLAMFLVAGWLEKKIKLVHEQLGKMLGELDTLSKTVAHLESMLFESELLRKIQSNYKQDSYQASASIQSLKKILDRLDLRLNIVLAVPLNLLFLWNFQQVLFLEDWKRKHDADVKHWFSNLGIIEALISFAVLKFNHPGYVTPVIVENHFTIQSINLGHPLIAADKRVSNDINLAPNEFIMLVTGSNMAGKSTYLRSVGVNTVLALAGAPVCAASFSISNIQLLSSMRIADNLQESTSTFYAELKKLKTIIEKVNAGEKVFILLDEILRGTNSMDRHAGSEALIKQLIQHKATAIIATHDLGLASLEKEYPQQLHNFHFDVQVDGEELFFDYELKPGICTSMNASILMKKIGIEM